MRMLLALLLGLYLAWPARAADSGPVLFLPGLPAPAAEAAPGPRCADFLDEAGLRPEGLEYLFCRPATDPRTGRRALTARYRVPGPQAAAVEAALRGRTGMAALERQAGIWQLPEGGQGRPVPSGRCRRVFPGAGRPSRPLPGALTLRRRKGPLMAQAPPLWTVPLPGRMPPVRRGRMRPLWRVLPLPGRPAR